MSLDFEASNFCSLLFTVEFFCFSSFFFFMYSLLVGRVGVGNVSPELEVGAFPPLLADVGRYARGWGF